MSTDSDPKFSTARLSNSRARGSFMRLSARTDPADSLDFFTVQDTDQAFALTVQRIKDILTGVITRRVTLAGGFNPPQHAQNTVPVLATFHNDVIPAADARFVAAGTPAGEWLYAGKWFVQPTDPSLVPANAVLPGDVWVK